VFSGRREVLILFPRGNGKTCLQALVALHHLLTVEDAEIFCCASSRDQARIRDDVDDAELEHVIDDLVILTIGAEVGVRALPRFGAESEMSALLPQPGGFEGICSFGELVHAQHLAAAQGPHHVGAIINLDSASAPTSRDVGLEYDAIPGVDGLPVAHHEILKVF
jgi:hypothetical protein